ncbi:MAG: group III truncated hemoglobin [Cohaesibacter sp.]|nr:group III truncated hemoglobin [Cohaesibacter sp.]MCV6602438.1 group III truncated hemoglobin [Cohaesibacter sp.]
MMQAPLSVLGRQPVHPSITEDQINQLVDLFYQRVREDDRLGPIFDARLEGQWSVHLSKMQDFWSSVLLRTGRFKGKPLPVHMKLNESVPEDFRIWLSIFRPTAHEIFEKEAALLVIETAERIAQSLWMAMFASPLDQIPVWMQKPEINPRYQAPIQGVL